MSRFGRSRNTGPIQSFVRLIVIFFVFDAIASSFILGLVRTSYGSRPVSKGIRRKISPENLDQLESWCALTS